MNQPANKDIPWSPWQMDDQATLFPMDRPKFSERSQVTDERLQDWYQLGLLSFDISQMSQLEEYHLAEVQIVSSLLAAGQQSEAVKELLASLPKPFRYEPRLLCYNFFLRAWQMVPPMSWEEMREEIETDLETDIRERMDVHVNELADEGDVSVLEELRDHVDAASAKARSVDADT